MFVNKLFTKEAIVPALGRGNAFTRARPGLVSISPRILIYTFCLDGNGTRLRGSLVFIQDGFYIVLLMLQNPVVRALSSVG